MRRVPIERLVARLNLTRYDVAAPLTDTGAVFRCVRLPMKQHIGAPARPVVSVGDRVLAGDVVGEAAPSGASARIHASLGGMVREVSNAVVIEADT